MGKSMSQSRKDIRAKRRRKTRQLAWDARHPAVTFSAGYGGKTRVTQIRGLGAPRIVYIGGDAYSGSLTETFQRLFG